MRRPCEICSKSKSGVAVISDCYVLVQNRVIALCTRHAGAVKKAKITTLAELREQFPETTGVRSLVPRRANANRRVFPPRPEGRRRDDGRRWDDELRDS